MAQKPLLTNSVLCKYDEYFQPLNKRPSCDMFPPSHTKKLSLHKHRLSGLVSPPVLPYSSQMQAQHQQYTSSRPCEKQSSPANKTLLRQSINQQQKSLKLQRLSPKSVTIKFEDILNSIPNNNSKPVKACKSPKLSKTISPFKIFEMAENKFYLQLLNQTKKQVEKQRSEEEKSTCIDSLFNVKSIKMIRKIAEQQIGNKQLNNEKENCLAVKKTSNQTNKYRRMLKNQTDFSIQYEKDLQHSENPLCNLSKGAKQIMKLSLKDLRKLQQIQTTTNIRTKRRQLLPLSQIKNRQKPGTVINPSQSKPSNSPKSPNRSASMILNHRKSKQLTPMVFSLNQDSINLSSTFSNPKAFDYRYLMTKKPDIIFEQKLSKYFNMLKFNAQTQGLPEIVFPQSYYRNQFNFYVGKGNNSKLVKDTIKKRWWLGSCEQKKDLSKNNIIWTQLKDKAYYTLNDKPEVQITPQVEQAPEQIQTMKRLIIHNHFEQNEFLGNKKALFYNMKAYYESINEDVFKYLPLTFHITSMQSDAWAQFKRYFGQIEEKKPEEKNIWILKPGENSNRGNGITVHSSMESIKQTIESSHQSQTSPTPRTFIIQKYIQKPLLYKNRKFDIRCYMLLTRLNNKIKGFWYKQGYIRTSCYQFTLEDCTNSFVHLTNDAVQKNCDSYGKFEDKNKLSYDSFQKYLDLTYNVEGEERKYDFEKMILPKLRKVAIDAIKASYGCLGKARDGLPVFELFGLDFMIDEEFRPWLIQINTNPCLETQGRVLEKVIVPLLDNVFKLSIDLIFPPPLQWSNSTKHLISKNIDKTLFEMVFDEGNLQNETQTRSDTQKQAINGKQSVLERIGQIDQDNQVYGDEEQ